MKKLNIMLGMGVLCAMPAMALTSPYTGSKPPAEGEAVFYLYQVDTQRWVQENKIKGSTWTTRAELGNIGLDIIVRKVEGGWQLDPRLNGNHSINGNNLWMDTPINANPVSVWNFEPVDDEGVSNGYKIKAISGPGDGYPHYLGVGSDNLLSTNDDTKVWQLVSAEDRAAYMIANAGTDKADATWMIPWQDFGRNNQRSSKWTLKHPTLGDGQEVNMDGIQRNCVRHVKHNISGYVHYTTLTGIPNGTYKVRVQGCFREEWNGDLYWYRYQAGISPKNAIYFAGASEHPIMHMGDANFTTQPCTDKDHEWRKNGLTGLWFPDNYNSASHGFCKGFYYNEWITAIVTDGTLTLGVKKPHGSIWDRLFYDNFEMQYVSTSTDGAEQQLNDFMASEQALLESDMATYPYNAVAAAMEKFGEATDINSLRLADLDYVNTIYGSFKQENVNNFQNTYALAQQEGVEDTETILNAFNNATDNAGVTNALKQLRYARRRHAAERHEDLFAGQTPKAGDFYLYNVGQKQFLCGGSDWGAHAALGVPGVLVTLEAREAGDEANLVFDINTHLQNGNGQYYLNYRGYMDCSRPQGKWKFAPVEGKEGVYNILQNDYPDVHVAYNPNASVDTQGHSDETTVGTECRNLTADDLDAQWKLVTKAERIALMEGANSHNPVDVSFLIHSPNFSKREKPAEKWTLTNANVWDANGNHFDFAIESWDTENFDMYQLIEGLPEGVYSISAQGYYRNGNHLLQPARPRTQYAILYAGEETSTQASAANDVLRVQGDPSYAENPFVNILEYANMAPGEGRDAVAEDGTVYHAPDNVEPNATSHFKLGLYKNQVAIHKYSSDTPLKIGAKKTKRDNTQDWAVLDNFRLKYYGKETSTGIEEVEAEAAAEAEAEANAPVYNLQGIRVSDTTVPGIYIRNGRKFVVK